CNAIVLMNGKWSTSKSGPQLGAPAGVPLLVLVDQANQSASYFFTLDVDTLSLRKAFSSPITVFHRDDAPPPPAAGTENGQCGGVANIPCAEGLTCQLSGPGGTDASGTCQKKQCIQTEQCVHFDFTTCTCMGN